jgi:hypothetical protein
MNKVAMKFLGTTTVIAPIVLIVLTIWMAFAFASPARAASPEMPSFTINYWCSRGEPEQNKNYVWGVSPGLYRWYGR